MSRLPWPSVATGAAWASGATIVSRLGSPDSSWTRSDGAGGRGRAVALLADARARGDPAARLPARGLPARVRRGGRLDQRPLRPLRPRGPGAGPADRGRVGAPA